MCLRENKSLEEYKINEIERILGLNQNTNSNWIDKGKHYFHFEWFNLKLNKTLVIQKETSGKYIVQLFSGGDRVIRFNKFLSKSLPLKKAKVIAINWMKKNK